MVSSCIISFSILSSPLFNLLPSHPECKVNPAAKEVTVDLIVQGVWGCAMLLHIVITHSNWTQGSPIEKQPSVI